MSQRERMRERGDEETEGGRGRMNEEEDVKLVVETKGGTGGLG